MNPELHPVVCAIGSKFKARGVVLLIFHPPGSHTPTGEMGCEFIAALADPELEASLGDKLIKIGEDIKKRFARPEPPAPDSLSA